MDTIVSVEKLKCFCSDDALVEIRLERRRKMIQGKEYDIQGQYCHCTQCGKEWVTPDQCQASIDQITTIKRRAQGFLAPEDIKETREKHGLTLDQAAAVFGTSTENFVKFERGEVYPSRATDRLIRVYDLVPEAKALLSQYIS